MPYFQDLLVLLKNEQEADRALWNQLQYDSSINERKAAGVTWYPVVVKETEIGSGDYLHLTVQRPAHPEVSSQFRFGASVALFSNHDPEAYRLQGTVGFSREDMMRISFAVDELPGWAQNGKLGVDLLFDETSYKEMETALITAAQLEDENRIIKKLTGLVAAERPTSHIPFSSAAILNERQEEAAANILNIEDIVVVHGPPGTGKTTTLVAAIVAYAQKFNKQVLVVAPSNAAVDLLSERLSVAGLDVLRIGNPARVSEELLPLLLDDKIAAHPQFRQVKQLRKQAASYFSMAHKYKRNFGAAEREQRKLLFREARSAARDAGEIEQYISNDIIKNAQVITATLVGANHQSIQKLRFDIVFIDEAAQALEPACWIPILKADKVVFAGDHCQLPPTVKSKSAAPLLQTLMEKVVNCQPHIVTLLNVQYRMHEQIMGFSSGIFYNNQLLADASVANRKFFTGDAVIQFIDTAGCGFEEVTDGTAISNPEEAAFSLKVLDNYLTGSIAQLGISPTIAVIAPYKLQVETLRDLAQQYNWQELSNGKVSINTIDSFQGQEKDIVVISLTRSNTEGLIGFLSDTRRMNVAITRAKRKLIVIGDSATISENGFYAAFIAYCEGQHTYHSAWEWML